MGARLWPPFCREFWCTILKLNGFVVAKGSGDRSIHDMIVNVGKVRMENPTILVPSQLWSRRDI